MTNSAMESPCPQVEKSSEYSGAASVEGASAAYSKDAPTDFQKGCSSTADQHLNHAVISGDAIQFGPADYGATPADSGKKPIHDGGATPADSAKQPLKVDDGKGRVDQYDQSGRLTETQIRDENGESSRYRYDEDGTKHYSHKDATGRLTEESMTRPDGSGVAREYGKDGTRKHITRDKDGNSTSNTFDKDGRLTDAEVRDSNGETTKHKYNADGTRHYSHYDSQGRLTEESTTNDDGKGKASEYMKDGSIKETNWNDGHRETRTFGPDGRMNEFESRQPNGEVSRYRIAADNTVNYAHKDAQGRVTDESMTRPDGSGESRLYGEDGSRTEISWDKNNNRRTLAYDKNNQRVRR